MQHQPAYRPPQAPSLRVLLIDDHEISRAACGALLRTEGLDVVADDGVGENVIALVAALGPNVVILDLAPDDDAALDLAHRLRALEGAPSILLTSSAHREAFGARLDSFNFIAKADICTGEVLKAIPSAPLKEKP
jgi:DNA-binding NarL/FixJ family response regulator